jgi:hypothetical protein
VSVLALRLARERAASARAVAERFIGEFCGGQFARAAELSTDSLSWFGDVLAPAQWAQRAAEVHGDATLAGSFVAQVDSHTLAAFDGELGRRLFDGVVDDTRSLFVYDITRADTTVSVGVLTRRDDSGGSRIERVIDLAQFKAALL